MKHWVMLPFFMAAAAEVMGDHGDRDGAAALIDRADELAGLTGEQWCVAEIIRLQARFIVRDPGEARRLLQSSLAVARKQNARLWELRTATELARLWHSQGNDDAARELLAPVYTWFTESLDTPDLVAARTLLEELD